MAQFSPSNQTIQVTTGNVQTAVDLPNPTVAGSGINLVGFPFPYPAGIFPNPLGSTFWDNAISVANPYGQPTKYRYVRCAFTLLPALQSGPVAVWYIDATMTAVTATLAESLTGTAQSFAGLIMPNTTALPNMTTAILAANGGAAVWIAVGGIVPGAITAVAAIGQQQVASQANWVTTGGFSTTAIGTAPVNRAACIALTAGSPGNVFVLAESI